MKDAVTEPIFFTSPDELREWFAAHHQTADELIVGYHKKHTGKPSVTWAQVVDEALCVGWIDGRVNGIDGDSHQQRITPRKARSHWSNRNVARMAELIAEGRVLPAGHAAFAARDPDNTGKASFEQPPASFDADQLAQFQANAAAWEWFTSAAPGYQRTATHLVTSAKKPETRARRLAELIACSAAGEKIPPLRR